MKSKHLLLTLLTLVVMGSFFSPPVVAQQDLEKKEIFTPDFDITVDAVSINLEKELFLSYDDYSCDLADIFKSLTLTTAEAENTYSFIEINRDFEFYLGNFLIYGNNVEGIKKRLKSTTWVDPHIKWQKLRRSSTKTFYYT